jgi:hypothetical protein
VKTQRESTFGKLASAHARNTVTLANPHAKPVITDEVIIAQDKETAMAKSNGSVNHTAVAKHVEPKAAAAAKPKPFCECGCGVQTAGGRFVPGHDAKLKSRLFAAARNGEEQAVAELKKRNWYYLMAAKKEPKNPAAVNRTTAEKEDDSFYVAMLTAGVDATWQPEVATRNDEKPAKRTRRVSK